MDLEQDTNQIYNAFVEAGLGTEARQLSTQKVVDGVLRKVAGLGHYIAILDSLLGNIDTSNQVVCNSLIQAKKEMAYYLYSIKQSNEYSRLKQNLSPKLFNQLDTVQSL
jgi:hypothetical protein